MTRIKRTLGDRIYDSILFLIIVFVLLVVLFPLLHVVSASFSSPASLMAGRVFLWPVNFSLDGYITILQYSKIWTGYMNTIFYTVVGTMINVVITLLAAYPLSRADLAGRNIFVALFAFTMMFGGGLIPTYMVVQRLGIINTRWSMLLPGALSVWNMVITRTYFQTNIPQELLEAAQLDGCSDIRFLISIALPLSGAIIAVITLYYAVGHWNAYFDAFIYLSKKELFPLQVILREILIANTIEQEALGIASDMEELAAKEYLRELLKYSLIIVSSAPVLCIYPFIQKFFVKGVMIGSLKG